MIKLEIKTNQAITASILFELENCHSNECSFVIKYWSIAVWNK